jgi:predicted lipid-binding transport protein (Tim44 family)
MVADIEMPSAGAATRPSLRQRALGYSQRLPNLLYHRQAFTSLTVSGSGAAALTMSEIFDLTNLLLMAVAVAIFLRLRSVLGRRTEDDRARRDSYAARDAAATARDAAVAPLPRADAPPVGGAPSSQSIDDRLGPLPKDSRALEPLRKIAEADPAFETGAFLNGAKIAYEAIVSSYAKGDRETLRGLLSREVFDSFNSVISDREARGETNEFSFVGIASAEIVDAYLAEPVAHVSVRFVSDLVTAVRDRSGNVIEGDIKAVRQVTDVWTFARDVSSPNPNWRLVATDSPEA